MTVEGAARPLESSAERLAGFIGASRRLVVLTGAGCSTESGIPDYRSPGGAWTKHKPILYAEFVRSAEKRRRYWARSFAGWERFAAARPNGAHLALCELERRGAIHHLITQNVDGLHQQAGSSRVVELHGSNHEVVCLDCRAKCGRAALQERMLAVNALAPELTGELAPDGDTPVERDAIERFAVSDCERCGGMLKPDVVFFGESVPPPRVEFSMARVGECDALLVVGSSLAVWSGFRFVRAARDRGVPVAIVNIGPTRADDIAALKLEEKCGELLPAAAGILPGC